MTFGLWTHVANGHEFLDQCNNFAEANDLSIYAIGGNHENWDHWNWFVDNMPTHKGFAMVRRRVLIAPKVHKWTWDNQTFGCAGGAVSIDRDWRLEEEKRPGNGPRTLWWPNEQLSDDDYIKAQNLGKVDYLLTHDCSNHTPWADRLKADPDSHEHRRKIDRIIKATQPDLHFHGHMHTQYNWKNSQSHGFYSPEEPDAIVTQTYGLECNGDWNAWGVLDTELGIFRFRGEGMQFRSLDEDGNTIQN